MKLKDLLETLNKLKESNGEEIEVQIENDPSHKLFAYDIDKIWIERYEDKEYVFIIPRYSKKNKPSELF